MQYLGLVVAAIFTITASAAGDPSSGSLPGEPIRVISVTHEIDFPNEVVFTVDAEADVDITAVTLFYRLGAQDTRIFGYPQFTRASRVTAPFAVKTNGSSYIPPGVDIEYYYVIRDAVGNTLESQRYSLEYKDTSYRWERFHLGDLTILWHDRPRDDVIAVVEEVDRRLRGVRQLLGLGTVSTMKAVILNNSREASRSFPLVSDAARRGHIYGGFAFGELDVFVLAGLNRDGIIHETTHLLIDEAIDSPRARLPAWLNEGLAMYFEASASRRQGTVSDAAQAGRLIPLRSMGKVPGRPRDISVFYAQSWSLVSHMMDTQGQGRMSALLRAINEGMRIEEAVPAVYGMSLDELDREWRTRLSQEVAFAPPADPGTLGTSVLIAGAVAVAVVAVLVRWFRNLSKSRAPDDAGE